MFGQRETRVLQLFDQHLDLVVKTVDELKALIELTGQESNSASVFDARVNMISIYESLADDAYLKAILEICEGAFFSGLREDFIKLLEDMDDIADFAKASSQILARNKSNRPLLEKLHNDSETPFGLFMEKIANSVKSLKDAISFMRTDIDALIKKCIEIKGWEEEADEMKSKLIDRLYSYKPETDVLTMLELKDLVLALDEIADAAERSSEILMIIASKARA